VEAIATLHKKELDPSARTVLSAILARLHEGKSFFEALAEHAAIFPQVLVAGVASGHTPQQVIDAAGQQDVYGPGRLGFWSCGWVDVQERCRARRTRQFETGGLKVIGSSRAKPIRT